MRVRVDLSFLLSLFLIFLINPADYSLVFLLSCTIHEIGHIVFLKIFKIKKAEISLGLAGADIVADTSRISYIKEFFVYMSGAIFNIISAVLSIIFLRYRFNMLLMFFFFSNLFLALVNLLPSKSLDGGRALECVLCMFFDPFKSERIALCISFLTSLFIVTMGLLAFFESEMNLTFLLFASTLAFESVYQTLKKPYSISG